MEKFILDRFEENYAVLERESGGTVIVSKEELAGAREGDVIIEKNGDYTIDKEETEKRKELISKKMRELFEKK